MSILSTLVLTACMIQQPSVCKDINVPVTLENPTELQMPFTCARVGQIEAQKYIGTHPDWHITRWKCPKPVKQEQDI
jgi:hypothetical protein